MPVRLSSTLYQLQVCPIATPSHMSVQKDENLSGPEEEGIAKASEFKFWSLNIEDRPYNRSVLFFLLLCCWNKLLILVFSFPSLKGKKKNQTLSLNNFVLALLF